VEYAESDKGKCLTCGFLAKHSEHGNRHAPLSPKYHEIEMDDRKRGQCFQETLGRTESFPTEPACFVWAFPLMQEVAIVSHAVPDRNKAASTVLSLERQCPDWFRYTPGLSPQEHFHRYEMQRTENARQKYEEDREKERRAFEERLEQERKAFDERLSIHAEDVVTRLAMRNEQLQIDREKEQARNTKLITRITLVGLFIAMAQVLTLTKDSILWKLIVRFYHWLFQ